MSRGAWRYANFENNTKRIIDFCNKYNLEITFLNNGYQIRIEGLLDVYPVRQKWCWLSTNERGVWYSPEDLRKLLLEKLPIQSPPIFVKKEGYHTLANQPQVMNILSTPAPKKLWPRLIWGRLRSKFNKKKH